MLRSMTGFGRADISTAVGKLIVEISSLNRKYLDVSVDLPGELSSCETEVRLAVRRKIRRGGVAVKVAVYFDRSPPYSVRPNIALAREIKSAWDAIADNLGIDDDRGFELKMLMGVADILIFDESSLGEDLAGNLCQAVENALERLVAMRIKEGENLTLDFRKRVARLREIISEIERGAQKAAVERREKLRDALRWEIADFADIEEKALREIAILVERMDISEEICRFNSHLTQFSDLFNDKEGAFGKKMEFIILELMREINAIASKVQDFALSSLTVEAKSELEKMRQQAQNIE